MDVLLCDDAAPPWRRNADHTDPYVARIGAAGGALHQAADAWDRLLTPFPGRLGT
ncbi:hypothetical protein OG422_17230 [Streptomyces sp. NBC_01525]|uniref:hypothetical protein n=1 Tax=Streptomyces sp. NBC_01525 TaxID=2903893 RepID=UPI00386DC3AA